MGAMKKKREERFTQLVQELAEDLDKPDMKKVKEVLVKIYKKNVPIDKRVVPLGETIPNVLVINYFIDLNFDATAVNRVGIGRTAKVFIAAGVIAAGLARAASRRPRPEPPRRSAHLRRVGGSGRGRRDGCFVAYDDVRRGRAGAAAGVAGIAGDRATMDIARCCQDSLRAARRTLIE